MFSYWEETSLDYGGERETKRKGRWLCLNVGREFFFLIATPLRFAAHIFGGFQFVMEQTLFISLNRHKVKAAASSRAKQR